MGTSRKGISPEQLKTAASDLGLTIATIAEGSSLSKAYISEFRSEKRNLTPQEQARLRSYIEDQYEQVGQEFPEAEDNSSGDLLQGLGGMIQRIQRPAIMLSDDVPKALAEKLTDLIEVNRLKVTDILATDFQDGGFLGGDFSDTTEDAIREVFALLALNYIAILMLQGRNIARQVPPDHSPKTLGDWLSRYLALSPLASLLATEEPASEESEAA